VKIWFAFLLACGMTAAGTAQEGAPSLSAADAQSLKAAMQVIQTELNAVGRLSFKVHVHDMEEDVTGRYEVEKSKVIADPASCTIRYHEWSSINGKVMEGEDFLVNLRDVQGLSTLTFEQFVRAASEEEKSSSGEKLTYTQEFTPSPFMVAMRIVTQSNGDDSQGFMFTNAKQADRVGKAFTQAVGLCGGKTAPY